MPEITVIIPVYKVEKYLKRCVESVLHQSFTEFELILVDDGSTDSCSEICDFYVNEDSRISVIHQKNRGLSAARNIGVSLVNSEWVSFIDSDDFVNPTMLNNLYHAAKSENVLLSSCIVKEGTQCSDDFMQNRSSDHHRIYIDEQSLLKLKSQRDYYCLSVTKLINVNIIKKYPFMIGRKYEDNAIVFRWLIEAQTVALLDDALYFYYQNSNSIVHEPINESQLDKLWAFQEQEKYYKSRNWTRLYSSVLEVRLLETAVFIYKFIESGGYSEVVKKLRCELLKDFLMCKKDTELALDQKEYIWGAINPFLSSIYAVLRKLGVLSA